MNSFRDVIGRWPSQRAFADAIGADPENARKWAQRNSIPSAWWPRVVAASADWEAPVTFDLLAALAEQNLREAS